MTCKIDPARDGDCWNSHCREHRTPVELILQELGERIVQSRQRKAELRKQQEAEREEVYRRWNR
jgi:hypothetical protein